MKKFVISIVILLCTFSSAFATHNRAGEITYQYTGDASHPYRYLITITTYAKFITGISNTDRCELEVNFGDGSIATAPRINGPSINCPTADGQMIATQTRLNIYKVEHNFPGPYNYGITVEDPNRNSGICNIPDSENASFFLRSELIINDFLGSNNSPTLLNAPIDDACVGACFEHNPGAYDVDGDSLAYSLTVCYANGAPILGYQFPPNMGGNSIDAVKGDLVWCVPPLICQYNIAILIREYRLLPGTSKRYYIGSIMRDMQITVGPCANTPPVINNVDDVCVVAGGNINFNVSATDGQANLLKLTATGGPLLSSFTPPATFSSTSGTGAANGTFNWNPSCTQVQLLPYLVTFKATDGDISSPLVSFESVFITVIAPPVTGLNATPSGASIILNWNNAICNTIGNNPLKKYYIYRKTSCDTYIPSTCETGLPASSGYTQIGSTNYDITTFTDNNGGTGLTNGIEYSYIVVAYYVDGSLSIASQNVCAHLVRDVPIITNVSVLSTGPNDSIWTHWVKPIGSIGNLDTLINPPPYEYRLMRATGFNPPASAFTLETMYSYPSYWEMTDTGYVSSGLNTEGSPYTYKVDFYSNGLIVGSTQTASSVFLSSTPINKQVNLSWQQFVPWNNSLYYIYKETNPGSSIFNLIDSTNALTYNDTGLVNEVEYCYKIISIGSYSDTTLPAPLFNSSQIKCETPVDLIPPCQPTFDVISDCDVLQNTITWTNPNTYCSDDAVQINIYFAPTLSEPLQIIYSITDMSITSYTLPIYYFDGVPSIAGCYAVTAVDSAIVQNESPIVNKICVDNCPEYELPNVFTPNGDGKNDLVTPLPNWSYVKDIEITIYDRWGLVMFTTSDPNILWDGTNQQTKQECPDGTYFYICTVNQITVEGITPRKLTGFIQLIRKGSNPNN